MRNNWLEDHTEKVHSMREEDGRIKKILEVISQKEELNKWCVEFGAWDGKYLSNTFNLIENSNYSAVLIEGSSEKFIDLKSNFGTQENIHVLNDFVGFEEKDGLDTLLAKTPIAENFDFLSIDIDGNDYHTWKSFSKYRPKLICIEFNPTIPNEVEFIQPPNPELNQGCSVLSLVNLGKEKGYELVTTTLNNAFFVDKKYIELFNIEDNSPQQLRTDLSRVTYLFSGYDGTVFIRGFGKLDLHNFPFRENKMQMIPKLLRGYADAQQSVSGKIKRVLYRTYKSIKKRI
jgi:hypothetical protein